MVSIGDGMRPKSTSPITINTLYIIVKIILADLLRPTSKSCIITPTITYFIFVNTSIHMARITRYIQKYTMVTQVFRVRVSSMGHISISPITTNSFSNVVRVKLSALFRPISTSAMINYYITPQVAIVEHRYHIKVF